MISFLKIAARSKFIWMLAGASAISFGCARVEVQAPKEPIKMDISMRLDVYQHVVKDIDAIEDIVSGKTSAQHALADFLVKTAYAADLDPAIEDAALRRRGRKAEVEGSLSQGKAGENNLGLLESRSGADQTLVSAENSDRMIIYEALAQKNGTSVREIQKVYAEKLRANAPKGSPLQNADGSWGTN
jgi:uncharacterized protein